MFGAIQVKLREMKPGMLSQELKEALGMPEGAPPPWLINMQVDKDVILHFIFGLIWIFRAYLVLDEFFSRPIRITHYTITQH